MRKKKIFIHTCVRVCDIDSFFSIDVMEEKKYSE